MKICSEKFYMKLSSLVINKDNLVLQVIIKNRLKIFFIVLISLIASFSELIFLKDMPPFVENILKGEIVERTFIIRQLILVAVWTFFGIIFRLKLSRLMAIIGRDMSYLIFTNISKLSLKKVEELGKSKITTLSTTYLENVINGICNPLLRLVEIFFTILVGIIVIFLNLGLSALPVIFIGISGLIFLIYITKSKSYEYGLMDSKMSTKVFQYLNFFIDNIKEIILQKDAKAYSFKFSDSVNKKFLASGKGMFLGDLPRKILESLLYFLICFLGLFKFIQTSDFLKTLPSLAVSLIVLQRITPLFQSAYRSIFSIINLIPVLKEYNFENSFTLFKCLYKENSKDVYENKFESYKKNISSIEIRNLSVGHEKKEILNIPSLSIYKGSPIVILGKSGSGKTSLLETIIGLRRPISGSCNFYYKNKKLSNFRNISYLPQSSQLAGETLFEMISFNNKSLYNYKHDKKIEKLIIHTLEICCIKNDFIKNLNDLHKPINEGASSLSGGQRQRIALARSLLKRNSLVVLDEATSGLDKKLEEKVISNLIYEVKDKILLCVTHSRGLTKYFDNVLNLTD